MLICPNNVVPNPRGMLPGAGGSVGVLFPGGVSTSDLMRFEPASSLPAAEGRTRFPDFLESSPLSRSG